MLLARASLAGLLVLTSAACRSQDPNDPATWMSALSTADQKARRDAIARARKQKARAAAPALAKALQDTSLREEAVIALGELGNADSVQPLLDAIDTKIGAGSDEATRAATRTNAKIAEALGALGDPKAGPALLRLA